MVLTNSFLTDQFDGSTVELIIQAMYFVRSIDFIVAASLSSMRKALKTEYRYAHAAFVELLTGHDFAGERPRDGTEAGCIGARIIDTGEQDIFERDPATNAFGIVSCGIQDLREWITLV